MSIESTDPQVHDAEILTRAKDIIEHRIKRGEHVSGIHDVRDMFMLKFDSLAQEEFGGLFLDSRHQIIAFEMLFRGTINRSNVYPRVVAKRALDLHAAAIIVGHNHPSGEATPSQADINLTRDLKDALAVFDVVLLDHLVVGGATVYSCAEHGLC